MLNLQLVQDQPRWRVALVARFAQLMGVLIHVEGIPFGSNRKRTRRPQDTMGAQGGQSTYVSDRVFEGTRQPSPAAVEQLRQRVGNPESI